MERYLSYCHSEKAKTLCTPKKAKLLIAIVGLFSLIYNIPAYCEHKYENIDGTIRSTQTFLAKEETYKLVYRASIGFIVRFIVPTICLVIFNSKIIGKVSQQCGYVRWYDNSYWAVIKQSSSASSVSNRKVIKLLLSGH